MTTTEKLEEKLKAAFTKLGIIADRIEINYPQGYWKSQDVFRWEGYATLYFPDGRQPKRCAIVSWDTASECVSRGDLMVEEEFPWQWQVHSPASLFCPNTNSTDPGSYNYD